MTCHSFSQTIGHSANQARNLSAKAASKCRGEDKYLGISNFLGH